MIKPCFHSISYRRSFLAARALETRWDSFIRACSSMFYISLMDIKRGLEVVPPSDESPAAPVMSLLACPQKKPQNPERTRFLLCVCVFFLAVVFCCCACPTKDNRLPPNKKENTQKRNKQKRMKTNQKQKTKEEGHHFKPSKKN